MTRCIRHALLALCILFAGDVWAEDFVRLTNLPAIYIETFNQAPIVSKTEYIYATMHYVDEEDNIVRYDSLQIRGRGNSTWWIAKKPYRIKFKEKEKFLGKGYAKARSWTLLANAADKSLMRNAITSLMGEFTTLRFNPAAKFVDFILNGDYCGSYQISDQVEVRPHRVNIAEQDFPLADTSDISGGYLLEVDGFYDGNCFTTSHYAMPIRIHYPDEDEIAPEQNEYIRQHINNFEAALCGDDYTDAERGYRQWVDSTSLADWYICTELSANVDGLWSTYFYKEQNDPRIFWGPLWDFDIAYNNDYRIPATTTKLMTTDGFGQARSWTNRMWTDPWFARLINRRYAELLDAGIADYLYSKIDSMELLLQESQELNYEKWGIDRQMYHEIVLYSSYSQYVADLKTFIAEHSAWLTTAFAALMPDEPETPGEPDEPETPAPFVPDNFYYRLTNARTGKAVDVENANIVQYTSTEGRASQEWQFKTVGDYFQIINRAAGLALNDPTLGEVGPTVNVGTALNVALPDETDFRQLWTMSPIAGSDCYNLINLYTAHAANLSGGAADDYTPIISYTNDGRNTESQNRQWRAEATTEITDSPTTAIAPIEPAEYALAYHPEAHRLHFESATPEQLTFEAAVYAADGRKVARFAASEGYDMSHEPRGTYIVVWRVDNQIRHAKLSIQ